MSRYSSWDYENMSYEMDAFLKEHKPSELLKLVQDAVERREDEIDEAD